MSERRQAAPHTILFAAVAVAVLAGGAAAVAVGPRAAPTFHGTTFTELAPAPGFALVDTDSRAVSLDDLRGAPALLFFGFTHCPDVCPLTLAKLTRAIERAGRSARDVRVVLVTVDPERDTPEVLGRYVRGFGPAVLGLTGDSASLAEARAGYGAYVQVHEGEHAGHVEVVHSSAVYGIDRHGNLAVVISESAAEDEVMDDVRALARL
jgi:protein SCO1